MTSSAQLVLGCMLLWAIETCAAGQDALEATGQLSAAPAEDQVWTVLLTEVKNLGAQAL